MGNANIPDDWLGDYKDFVVRWPSSDQWEAILRGQLTAPDFTDFWDLFSGDPEASMIAMDETLDTNLHLQEGAILNAGLIMDYAGSTIPDGWLVCDGSEISRTDYARLFTAIGTIYGIGDGSTTFELPNIQGRTRIALNPADADFNNLGDFGGQKEVTLETSEIPAHTHTQDGHNHIQDGHNHTQNSHNHVQDAHTHTFPTPIYNQNATVKILFDATGTNIGTGNTPNSTATNQAETATNQAQTATNQAATATNQTTGGGTAHNNMSPYFVVNTIIKT